MAGGKITRVVLQKSTTDVEGDFKGFYRKLSMTAGDNNAFKAKTTNHGKPEKEPKAGKYFVKGWWTNHKNQPIKRAVYGQFLRFHIEMDKTYAKPGDIVYFEMFDSDMRSFGNDVVKADDPIGLEHKDGSHKPYTYEKVNSENKVIIEFSTTDNLEQWTSKLDQDKIFELYFRCSYVNKGGTEHVELPYNFHDYLQLGTLVIDRYKMPGLKPDGSDIADDMTYGTGHPHKKLIYSADRVSKYKEEYKTFGFDMTKHALFADAADDILYEPLMEKEPETPKDPIKEIYKIPIDNATIAKDPIDPIDKINLQIRVRNKNVKAIYSKEEIENLGNMMKFSMETDFRLWFNLRTLKAILAWGELSPVLDEMIDKFQRNEGGIYESPTLTKAIKESVNTDEYLQKVEDYIAGQLNTKFAKLEEVEDTEPYFEKLVGKERIYFNNLKGDRKDVGKEFKNPSYTYWDKKNLAGNLFSGKTLALNDIWSTEIYLKEVKFTGDDYLAKYEVFLWDHFGLDIPDVQDPKLTKPYYFENGFRAWFILQHIKGFKPFLTKMTFTQEFKGNLNKNKAIENPERKQRIETEQKEDREKAERIREIMSGPKF
ncbi:hypothetical protein GCM10023210_21190 [Chryseobacterium ginsengisoli]|uniref:DUF3289 domain-containing protein n=2 Tax=Chryseobacterium ginsengisoli TaxID=363853 RepID=A0ABP9M7C2_9FLAO